MARANNFPEIIVNNSHQPRVLFNTINSILEPSISVCLESSVANCERCVLWYSLCNCTNEVKSWSCCCSFRAFKMMSLSEITEIMGMLKVTSSTNEVIPTSLFIEVFDIIGPYILLIINKSLAEGCIPSSLKHAVVEPSQQAPDVYVTSGWRWTWRQTDVAFWLKMKIGLTSIFDVNLTLT